MTKTTALILLILLSSSYAHAQRAATATAAPAPIPKDTITYYLVDSESMSIIHGAVVYKVNTETVSEQQWQKMTLGNSRIKTCTPCMVRTYSAHDTLLSIGQQYRWCQVGVHTAFYPDGSVKATGQYKKNTAAKSNPYQYCGVKDGTWTYYDRQGKVSSTELYKDGKLIKADKAK
jgi:hypothetical protein